MSKRLEMLETMIAGGSTDPFHYYARAMELHSNGAPDQALAAFDEVAERFPDYVATFLMAGQLALELDRPDEGRRWLQRGLVVARAAGEEHAISELEATLKTLEE